jgi:hypothetical protein
MVENCGGVMGVAYRYKAGLKFWRSRGRALLLLVGACLLLLAGGAGCTAAPAAPTPTAEVFNTPIPVVTLDFSEAVSPLAPEPTPTAGVPLVTLAPADGVFNVVREGGTAGHSWTLDEFRYAFHKDRLRVVWQMAESGTAVPRYRAVQVDNGATPFPTGYDPVWGAARIDLVMSGVSAPNFPFNTTFPVTLAGNPVATRIGLYPAAEGGALGFSIGLHGPQTYEVYELTDPVRIVIDVVYP